MLRPLGLAPPSRLTLATTELAINAATGWGGGPAKQGHQINVRILTDTTHQLSEKYLGIAVLFVALRGFAVFLRFGWCCCRGFFDRFGGLDNVATSHGIINLTN